MSRERRECLLRTPCACGGLRVYSVHDGVVDCRDCDELVEAFCVSCDKVVPMADGGPTPTGASGDELCACDWIPF